MSFSTALSLALVMGASARIVNITIDDQYGDARTGRLVSYDKSACWAEYSEGNSDSVVGTLDRMDWTRVQNGTLHYAHLASDHGMQIYFEGTAIYAFFVLDSRTSLSMTWFLENDSYAAGFHYDATTGGPKYRYQTLGLSRENLIPGPHQARIMFNPPKVNNTSVGNVTVMFDYAVYTTEVDDVLPGTSTAKPQRHRFAILCGILGCALLVILAALLWRRRGRKRERRARIVAASAAESAASDTIIVDLRDELARVREENEQLKQSIGPPPEYSDGMRSELAWNGRIGAADPDTAGDA